MMRPDNEKSIISCVRSSDKMRVCGNNTLGLRTDNDNYQTLSLGSYEGIISFSASERLLEVRSGTRISEINNLLAEHNQRLAFDPPDYGGIIWGEGGNASIGGALCGDLGGGGRLRFGGARDCLLGAIICNGEGTLYKSGGKTVKNVSGFDIGKMIVGSRGRMGILMEAYLKTIPESNDEVTLIYKVDEIENGGEICRELIGKNFGIVAATFCREKLLNKVVKGMDAQYLLIRIEGGRVQDQVVRVADIVGTPDHTINSIESKNVWQQIRDGMLMKEQIPLISGTNNVWQILTSQTRGREFLKNVSLRFQGSSGWFEWFGGRVWIMLSKKYNREFVEFVKQQREIAKERIVVRPFIVDDSTIVEELKETNPIEARLLDKIRDIHDPRRVFIS